MRKWFDFILKKKKINNLNRFNYTDETLIKNVNSLKNHKFKNFKKTEHAYKTYKFLKKNLDKKELILFNGSGWAYTELFLSKKLKVIASDCNNEYFKFHKKNKSKNFKYIILDILKKKKNSKNKCFKKIVVNNIEYLFNDNELNKCIKNIKKLGNKNTTFFIIFRSRDGLIIKLIDKYLIPLEIKCKQFLKNLNGAKLKFTKNLHGFRRSKKEFIYLLKKNNLKIDSVYEDVYEDEYNRLAIIRHLKLSKFFSFLFLKSHPYLNIITFRFK